MSLSTVFFESVLLLVVGILIILVGFLTFFLKTRIANLEVKVGFLQNELDSVQDRVQSNLFRPSIQPPSVNPFIFPFPQQQQQQPTISPFIFHSSPIKPIQKMEKEEVEILESESESESETESEYDTESDTESESESEPQIDIEYLPDELMNPVEEPKIRKIVVNLTDIDDEISIDIDQNLCDLKADEDDVSLPNTPLEHSEHIVSVNKIADTESESEEIEIKKEDIRETEKDQPEIIEVELGIEETNGIEEMDITPVYKNDSTDYQKMDLKTLKSLITSRGLAESKVVSKMKKQECIDLLRSATI
jgi:hypothetical protein